MRKKLTMKVIQAICDAYEEAADHLDSVASNPNIETLERDQLRIVEKQIRELSAKFFAKYSNQHP